MPSDIGAEKKAQSQRQQQQPSCITWPQTSQSYRCIETFETKDTKNKSFKVTKKEIVEVLIKDMTGMFDWESSVAGRDGRDGFIGFHGGLYIVCSPGFTQEGRTKC